VRACCVPQARCSRGEAHAAAPSKEDGLSRDHAVKESGAGSVRFDNVNPMVRLEGARRREAEAFREEAARRHARNKKHREFAPLPAAFDTGVTDIDIAAAELEGAASRASKHV
jgi:hypothetical protein